MKISVFGLGYVGSIQIGCLARLGHTVIGLDANPAKTAQLGRGMAPVREPGLTELIAEGRAASRILVGHSPTAAILDSDMSLICVGTPALSDGRPDDRQLHTVIDQIANACQSKQDRHLIVVRSTTLPTTHDALLNRLRAAGLIPDTAVGYVVHPEFLREGNGVEDFFDPAFLLFGGATASDRRLLDQLYPGLEIPVYHVDRATASLTKYAGNLFHAVKVAFANEIASWSEALGADGRTVMELLIADHKLNLSAAYLSPGLPFGGSCLSKDLAAALQAGDGRGLALPLLAGTAQSNRLQIETLATRLILLPHDHLLLIGLAFKPNTDDLRDSPLVLLARRLLDGGKRLRIYAPEIVHEQLTGTNLAYAERWIPELPSLLTTDLANALSQCSAVLVGRPPTNVETKLIQSNRTIAYDLARVAEWPTTVGTHERGIVQDAPV